jgi:hypothetical protein
VADSSTDICPPCGHPVDPHAVIVTGADYSQGGIMLCPEPGCPCLLTWSTPDSGVSGDAVRMPSPARVQALRDRLQSGTLTGTDWSDLPD